MNQEVSGRIDELNARRLQWYKKLISKRYRKRVVRYSLLTINVIVMVVVVAFVTQKPETNTSSSPALSAQSAEEIISNPLDELSAADVAVSIANVVRLPESIAVTNLADSVSSQASVSTGESIITAKPQIIATGLPSRRDIKTYVTVSGDTVTSIADKFGVTSDTIRWSNNIAGNEVAVGRKLYISPIDGILYVVQSSDTIESIVSRYQSNKERFVAVNDLEATGLPVGERVIIPDGQKPSAVTRTYSAYASGFAFGGSAVYGYNGYDYGYCTWWAAKRRADIGKPVPANFGHASFWFPRASAANFSTGNKPEKGAVIWSVPDDYFGHVGFVESVNANGNVNVSEMNVRGWNVVSKKTLSPAEASKYRYIY